MRLGIFKKLYAFMEKAGREYRNKNDLAELQKTLEELKTYFPKSILPASLEGLAQYPAKGF